MDGSSNRRRSRLFAPPSCVSSSRTQERRRCRAHQTTIRSCENKCGSFLTKNAKIVDSKDGVLAYLAIQHANPKERAGAEYPVHKFWVDKAHGYTTTQIQTGSFVTSELTWKLIDNVYVPVAFRQRYHSVPANQKVEAKRVGS